MNLCRTYTELHNLIKNIKTAMMTVCNDDGSLHSMPLMTMKTECEGSIWFFINVDEDKIKNFRRHRSVNLSYSDISKNIYVSISGKVEVVTSRSRMQEMWRPYLTEKFPKGLDEENLVLLKIHMDYAEAWDEAKNEMIQIWDIKDVVII